MKSRINHYLNYLKSKPSEDPYININYWKEEGKKYFNNYDKLDSEVLLRYETQADLIIKLLSKLDFNSVCEIGCGFGRITNKMLEAFDIQKENYLAFDLSSDQIQQAKKLFGDKAQFLVSTIDELNVSRKFDLVLASEVLMHIPHNEIQQAISKMVNLSSKYIVNIDWKETDSKKSSFCNFAHDYVNLYNKHGLDTKVINLNEMSKDLTEKINQNLNLVKK